MPHHRRASSHPRARRSSRTHDESRTHSEPSDYLSSIGFEFPPLFLFFNKLAQFRRYILIFRLLYSGFKASRQKTREVKTIIKAHPIPAIAVSTVIGFLLVRKLFK